MTVSLRVPQYHWRLVREDADDDETQLAIVRALLEAGADPNTAIVGGTDETPLHGACWNGKVGVVRALVEAGADVNRRDRHDKTTPLVYAVKRWSFGSRQGASPCGCRSENQRAGC